MNKKKFWSILMILLPVLAVSIAMYGGSVSVFPAGGGTVEAYNYFALVPDVPTGALAPLAGILCCAAEAPAVGYAIAGKKSWLTALMWIAGLALFASTLPTVMRTDPRVVPNVGVPILMAIEAGTAYVLRKKNAQETSAVSGPRLSVHKFG